jgi:succinoglycan biosynthesis protein ExoA
MSAAPVDVSVLTPVLNEERHLRATVEDMLSQRFHGTVEFLFIDGGSTDRSLGILADLAARDGRIRVLDNPLRRTQHALNIGLQHARGTYVARMDAHTHYPPDYLEIGVRRLRRGDVASVSGPQLAVGNGAWSRRVALALGTALGVGGARFRRVDEAEVEVDSGFTGLWLRQTLVAHGGWDEGWPNDEDYELAARLRAEGGRIVCVPEMAASYRPRETPGSLAGQYWTYGFYRVKTSRRHPASIRRSQILPPLFVLTVLGAALPSSGPRTIARAGLSMYGLAVLGATAQGARTAGLREAAPLPAVYLIMHGAYGAGFLAACAWLGPPAHALAHIALGRGTRRS